MGGCNVQKVTMRRLPTHRVQCAFVDFKTPELAASAVLNESFGGRDQKHVTDSAGETFSISCSSKGEPSVQRGYDAASSRINDFIFLGNLKNARSPAQLERDEISRVLSVTEEGAKIRSSEG